MVVSYYLSDPGSWSPVATVSGSYATPPTNQASFFRLVQP